MHIQIRTSLKTTAFADEVEDEIGSVDYPKGEFEALLSLLADDQNGDPGFNLAAAAGHDIELGGEFSFWVEARHAQEDHEAATTAAMERLRGAGYDAVAYHVQAKHLANARGALRDFVHEINARGLHVVEISIGAPDADGVPVQVYTAKIS